MSDEFEDEDLDIPGPGLTGTVLPFATAVISLALGAALGAAIAWIAKPADQIEVPVPRDLTAAELEAACAPAIADKARDLEDAHEKVRELNTAVATKEAKVAELEAEMQRRAERGRAMVAELERAKAELAEMKVQLEEAEAEKERLYTELTITTAKLEEQIVKTENAREDALTNKWYRFINDAQLEICERGNRKKLGRCRETVQENLSIPELRDKFAHCVRSNQATPVVREIESRADLPEFAQWIDQDDKITKDWYIDLCDPTLPEAEDGDWNEEHLPPTQGDEGTGDPLD